MRTRCQSYSFPSSEVSTEVIPRLLLRLGFETRLRVRFGLGRRAYMALEAPFLERSQPFTQYILYDSPERPGFPTTSLTPHDHMTNFLTRGSLHIT